MNKVAIISDVHGNYSAFKAVIDEILEKRISVILALGDWVGYYYSCNKIFTLLRDLRVTVYSIGGNHERMLMKAINDPTQWNVISKKYGHGLEIAYKTMDSNDLQYLLNLPERQIITIDNKKILLCHGSPRDKDEYIYPDTDILGMDFSGESVDYILLGHTHYPMVCNAFNKMIINPGSVGQARNRGGIANWAILNLTNGVVTMESTKFNVDAVVEDCFKYDPDNKYLKDVFKR